MKTDYLKTSLFYPITIVCLICFLLTFVSVNLSTSLGIILSFWLIMRGRPDGMLGLFLLYFVRYYFYNFANGSMVYEERDSLVIAGFPLTVETVVCGFICLRVFLEKIICPETYKAKFLQILFSLWIAAFIPVLIGFYLGYQVRDPNWTRGLRWLMISGSYFYGYILAKRWPKGGNSLILVSIFLPLVFIMLLLMNLGVYWSHHGFLFLGLGGAFSIYFMQNRLFVNRILGMFLFCLSVWYTIRGSLTSMGITFLSIFLFYLGSNKRKVTLAIRHRILKFVGVIAILGILFFSFGIGFLGYHPDFKPSLSHGSYVGTFAQRVEAKALSDRLPFWHPALRQIIAGPHFIVSFYRPLLLGTPGLPEKWWVGAHNVVLETLRINGLFAGIIMLIILFLALKNNILVLIKSADSVLKALAAGVLGVAVVGMITGDFPADMTVGFWIWSLAGLCHGLFLQHSALLLEDKQLS